MGRKNSAIPSPTLLEPLSTIPICLSVVWWVTVRHWPSGALVQGYDITKVKKFDELETNAEDAFVMAMFNER